jgi:hypothetical protein
MVGLLEPRQLTSRQVSQDRKECQQIVFTLQRNALEHLRAVEAIAIAARIEEIYHRQSAVHGKNSGKAQTQCQECSLPKMVNGLW